MEFQFQDVRQGFTSPDFLYNFEPAGDLAPKYKAPPAPNSIENLTVDYIQKQRQVSDAIAQQHRIDNIYERVMNEAPRRDVEVLPPENPADVFNPNKTRMKNITPVEQQQEISNLLERQVKRPTTPSVAEPPVTPSYKSIPLTDPMATPPTFTPRKPVSGPNPAPGAKPSGLPSPPGRFAAPLVGGAIDFGFRVVAGQSPAQAAAGAIGSTVGGLVGGALGSAVGPVGTFVGGVIGGFVGGAVADFVYNFAFPPSATIPPQPITGSYPFTGGQTPTVAYRVSANADVTCPSGRGNAGTVQHVYGPVTSIRVSGYGLVPGSSGVGIIISAYDNLGNPKDYGQGYGFPGCYSSDLRDINITRLDGQPDTGGNPPANPIPQDNRTPNSYYHPGNQSYAPPTGTPGIKPPAPNNYAPGGFTPNGSPRGDSPNRVPHGFPAPKSNPNPNTTPSNLGGNFPSPSPNPAPSPSPSGVPSPNPSPNPPGYKVDSPGGKPSGSPSGSPGTLAPPNSTPSGLPIFIPQTPAADGFKPVPQPNLQPQPTPPQTDICEADCIQSMGQQITQNQIFWVDLIVPTVVCSVDQDGYWFPITTNQSIQVIATLKGNEIAKTQIQFEELAKANTSLCLAKNIYPSESDCVLTLPERYQIPIDGQIPQLICVFREVREDNTWGERMYPMTIPHPKSSVPPTTRPLPDYKKGSWELMLTLKDNTKVFVNAVSMAEANTMVDYIKPLIADNFLENSFQKIGQRKGQQLLELKVRVFKVDYFEKGTKNAKPTWSKYFRS